MLEILIVIMLCKNLGKRLREKGHTPLGYQVLLVVLWVGGEFTAAMLGGAISEVMNPGREPNMLLLYGFALVGAATGAGITFLIANSLSPTEQAEKQYREEPYFQEGHAPGNDQFRRRDEGYRS
ncbi:MAG: hypothetical protein K2R98_07415 [Gemmataceae bacterium]|nr:hypothetical protein [Gemmataceae bacterium]